MEQLRTPTRIVWGEQDQWLPVDVSAAIESRLSAADRILVPSAEHFSPEDQPAQVAIIDFVR